VEYQYGGSLPIGLYVVAEQPSGVAKTRCLNVFQKPFYSVEVGLKKDAESKLDKLKKDKGSIPLSDEEAEEQQRQARKRDVRLSKFN
jgi:hypothetical protein